MSNTKTTTKVIGYFNPQKWPLALSISAAGFNRTIPPGGYILNHSGEKINDPILDRYVGSKMLSREVSKEDVEIVSLGRPKFDIPENGVKGFSATNKVKKDSRGIVLGPDAELSKPTVPSSKASIKTYTVADAVNKKVIKAVIIPKEVGMVDSKFMRGEAIQSIDKNTPRDVKTPKEAKIVEDQSKHNPTSQFVHEEPGTPVAIDEAAMRAKLADDLEEFSPDELTAPPVAEVVNVAEEVSRELEPKSDKKFYCSKDGRSFSYYKSLENYVKKTYPDEAKELLSPYVKSHIKTSSKSG